MRSKYQIVFAIALFVALVSIAHVALRRVNPYDLAVYQVAFVVTDETTGERINVSVGLSGQKISEYLKTSSRQKAPPVHLEMTPNGPYRVTWLDIKESPATIEVSCDGYAPLRLDRALYTEALSSIVSGGPLPIHELQMKPTQQGEAPAALAGTGGL